MTRRVDEEAMDLLRRNADVVVPAEDRPIPRDALLDLVAGAHGILAMLTDRVDEEVLDAAGPQLVVVTNHAVGYDNVDVEACERRGIVVTNTPDVLTEATADLAWGLLLAAARRIVEGDRLLRRRSPWEWAPAFMLGREVAGSTLGIVGYGRIGRAVARRAAGFGMQVLVHTRTPAPGVAHADLPALLAASDAISIHVPLTPRTRGMFGAEAFGAMKPSAILVNTSRGGVVDEAALAAALATGRIAAAGLDVYEQEPDPHPALLELENVVLAPHLGSATVETRRAMAMLAARNLLAVLSGEPPLTPVGAR